VVKSSDIVS